MDKRQSPPRAPRGAAAPLARAAPGRVALPGQIEAHGWFGAGPQGGAPPPCGPGIHHWTVMMTGEGYAVGDRIVFCLSLIHLSEPTKPY